RHDDKEQGYLYAGKDAKDDLIPCIVAPQMPVRCQKQRQNKERDRDQFTKPATCKIGEFQVRRILHKLHTAEKIRYLKYDKAQEQQIDKAENYDRFNRAKCECLRKAGVVPVLPIAFFR